MSQREEWRMSRNRVWNLTVWGDFICLAKMENSKRAPVRLSEELKEKQVTASQGVRHFANLHCTGVSSVLAFARHPAVVLQSRRGLCSVQRAAQACQGLQIHLHWTGIRGRQPGKGASHRDELWGQHSTTQACVIPVMLLIAVIYNGAGPSFTPQNGAVCFAVCVKARQRRD